MLYVHIYCNLVSYFYDLWFLRKNPDDEHILSSALYYYYFCSISVSWLWYFNQTIIKAGWWQHTEHRYIYIISIIWCVDDKIIYCTMMMSKPNKNQTKRHLESTQHQQCANNQTIYDRLFFLNNAEIEVRWNISATT